MVKIKVERGRSKQYYFFKSLAYMKPYKGYAFICVLSCALVAGVSVLFPFFVERSLTAFTNQDGHSLLINASLLLVCQLLASVIHMLLWGTSADRLRSRVTRDIRYNTVDSIMNLKTKNFVAHRLSTIVDADIIHFLKDGKILTSGTHKQLLKRCKEYKRLYEHENTRQVEVEKV